MTYCKVSSILCLIYALYDVIYAIILFNTKYTSENEAISQLGTAVASILTYVTGLILCIISLVFILCAIIGLLALYKHSQKVAVVADILKLIASATCLFTIVASNNIDLQTIISITILATILVLSIKEIIDTWAKRQ